MDFTMFIGIILATALMIYGMGIPNLGNFFDVQSIVIVLIGTLATLFSGYGIKAFKQVPKHIKLIMAKDKFNAQDCIAQIVEMAQIARKKDCWHLKKNPRKLKIHFSNRVSYL